VGGQEEFEQSQLDMPQLVLIVPISRQLTTVTLCGWFGVPPAH